MSEETKPLYFKVTGYVNMKGEVAQYFIADSEGQVSSQVMAVAPNEGGFVRFSGPELLEKLPDSAWSQCTHCKEKNVNPYVVHDLRVSASERPALRFDH
jgi:hypothetical protein